MERKGDAIINSLLCCIIVFNLSLWFVSVRLSIKSMIKTKLFLLFYTIVAAGVKLPEGGADTFLNSFFLFYN